MVVLETPLVTIVHKEDNLNLVQFCDVQEWYSLEEDIVLEFILDKQVKGSTFDWIGLFREDWNTFESFLTFQRGLGSPVSSDTPRRRKAKFAYSKQLIDSVVLDFRYQFVYVNKYLDILGMSSLFRFFLPLKTYFSKESKVLPTSKILTLSEELLLSENQGGKSFMSTCRLHKNPLLRNTVTTCTHCRPCGHDYFNMKEKMEYCFYECMRLGERVSELECEVAMNTLKLKKINQKDKISDLNNNSSADQIIPIPRTLLTKSKVDHNPSSLSNLKLARPDTSSSDVIVRTPVDKFISNSTCEISAVQENNARSLRDKESKSSSQEIKLKAEKSASIGNKDKKRDAGLINETARCSSYPPATCTSQGYDNPSCIKQDQGMSSSDGKLNSNAPLSLSDVDSPLLLKAIIGRQEERIRRLSQLLNEHLVSEDSSGSLSHRDEDVVKLVRTEQRMLAQILRVNSNCEEFTTE